MITSWTIINERILPADTRLEPVWWPKDQPPSKITYDISGDQDELLLRWLRLLANRHDVSDAALGQFVRYFT